MSNSIGSWDELEEYLGSYGLLGNDDVLRIAEEQSAYLEGLIQNALQNYYNSYEPVQYSRTFDMLNSIRVNAPEVLGSEIVISVGFDETLANHPSYVDPEKYDEGYSILLLSQGWQWHVNPFSIYRFSYFEGTHLIQSVVEEYNMNNPYRIVVEALWDDVPIG